MLHLYIGNKNYSSWSMRPWVLLHQTGIPFQERMVRFDAFSPESQFKQSLAGLSPTGKVPVLVDDDTAAGPVTVWDTLAIAEYLAERFPHKSLWPANPASRATARSVCAEMHSGFGALRNACPLNIEASLPEVGALLWRDNPGVRADVDRLTRMWEGLLAQHGGPMLFGEFSIADAYFAPVCMRLHTYALPITATVKTYVERVRSLPSVQAWVEGALAEQDFLVFEEPYRLHR
jgi:glutathione S-transferase